MQTLVFEHIPGARCRRRTGDAMATGEEDGRDREADDGGKRAGEKETPASEKWEAGREGKSGESEGDGGREEGAVMGEGGSGSVMEEGGLGGKEIGA
ncbi:hypothetical protein ACLOJK_023919 [Asimina triloba]